MCTTGMKCSKQEFLVGVHHLAVSLNVFNVRSINEITKLKSEAEEIEKNLSAMAKECDRTAADFDDDTNVLVQKLRQSRDDQVMIYR